MATLDSEIFAYAKPKTAEAAANSLGELLSQWNIVGGMQNFVSGHSGRLMISAQICPRPPAGRGVHESTR